MTSTTLMTFLLCAPPHVRSVKLLGSWDNFSKPYVMERDRRTGAGQWRGCHTFTDIVCDGQSQSPSSRSGGLKMGATYWYYYLLDDDVEYHNEAEPVTSRCPFLPGQPVNVLHVPVILPDTHSTSSRDQSLAGLRTDHRTMNPEDKFMNPRQPPKPKASRLRTSPPHLQEPTPAWSFNASPLGALVHRSASQPRSATHSSGSLGNKSARSVSPPRSRGIRSAFRQWNASSPDLTSADQLSVEPTTALARSRPRSRHGHALFGDRPERSASDRVPPRDRTPRFPDDTLLLRRPASAGSRESQPLSIQDRRARSSSSSAPSSSHVPLTVQTRPGLPRRTTSSDQGPHARPAQKFLAPLDTKIPPLLATAAELALSDSAATPRPSPFTEKRLPTLPNSPSSVMDDALADLDERERALDVENLGSHFSDLTETDASSRASSSPPCERSRFSSWSTDNEVTHDSTIPSTHFPPTTTRHHNHDATSPVPDSTEVPELLNPSTTAEDPDTPHLPLNCKPSPTTVIGGDDSPCWAGLPPPHHHSADDLDIPSLSIEDTVDDVETNPKRYAAFFGEMDPLEALGLAKSPDAPVLRFPERGSDAAVSRKGSAVSAGGSERAGRSEDAVQEMLDELSYLKNMI
ncbi:uncharacterized protein BDW47DRAFT_117995 [Aspergillus candidus]|uniref:Uncharacterized protein n=1 Tax=Aspergillus candidus TaxID=41067 RepID=A0A2I2F9Q3_ASPCN|nr:hypothetical protein BDW47DRAFT_117995 [Aspergillus candidus]PLB37357.1 hypothetical protein BDW47DRAFT_117995 [Aspergillus candidus]